MDFGSLHLSIDQIQAYLNNLTPSWTVFGVMVFLVLFFVFIGSGLGRAVNVIISVYISFAIINTVPFFKPDGPELTLGGFAIKLASFLSIIILILLLVSRFSISPVIKMELPGRFGEKIVFSFFAAAMLVVVALSFLPQDMISQLNPEITKYFISEWGLAAWMILPLLFLLFVRGDAD